MESFFIWLEELRLSSSIAESSTLYGFALVLVLHTIGIALTAGPAAVMSLRLLGIGRPLPLSSLRTLFTLFWVGFIGNAITGALLFMMAASRTGYKPMYYTKLLFLALALITLRPIRAAIEADRDGEDATIPRRMKTIAVLSLLLWAGVITSGRLIAYTK
jgi:hypothetical protein